MSQYLDKDGASRIAENFLSKQSEQDAILQNLQFDLKEAEHALVKTIQGPAPLNIRALTRPLDDYMISGNTIQDGTPSPEAPVDVVGCGVRTGNLYEKGDVIVNVGDVYKAIPISLSAGKYTFSFVYESENTNGVTIIFYNGSTTVQYSTVTITDGKGTVIIDAEQPITTIRLYSANGYMSSQSYSARFSNIMLNLGSTPLPYEPYGYKLPISCGGTTTNVYLGEQSATRRIKKRVLTGEEGWTITSNGVLRIGLSGQLRPSTPLCTHYSGSNATAWSNVPDKSVTVSISGYLAILDTTYTSAGDFNSYLAQQYAAGTPVTIWYVLATPTTGIVNEPLHKIGDYADTISMTQAGVEISTTKGFNTITTGTTVLPSNIEVKGVINNA